MPKATLDLLIIICLVVLSFLLFGYLDLLETVVNWSKQHEEYEIDEIISSSLFLVFCLLIFSVRRWRETQKKSAALERALAEIQTLRGIIPICGYCKKIRDDEGVWNQLEAYIHTHSDAQLSHGICPECYEMQLRDLNRQQNQYPAAQIR